MKIRETILSIIFMSLSVMFTACDDEINDKPGIKPESPGENPTETVREVIKTNVAMLSDMPADEFGEAVSLACPTVSSLDAAHIAIVTGEAIGSVSKKSLLEFFKKGGLVIVINPDSQTDDYLINVMGSYYSPLNDNNKAMLFAFNNRDKFFIILKNRIKTTAEQPLKPMDEETFNSLNGKKDPNESENTNISENKEPEKTELDDLYYYNRIDEFIKWVNKNYDNAGIIAPKQLKSRSNGSNDPTLDISRNYYEINCTMPIELDHEIDRAALSDGDFLRCNTDITYHAYIYPLYVHPSEGTNDASGDYYIVDGTITAHNGDVWHPRQCTHGWTNNRLIGYFMKDLQISTNLADNRGNVLEDISFYQEPMPTTTVNNVSYNNSYTFGVSGGINGKGTFSSKGFGGEIGADVSFSGSWTTGITQSFTNVNTQRFTNSDKQVKYKYSVVGINNERDWDKKERNYPLVSRSDFSARSVWVWKIPYGKHGVAEGLKTSFKLNIEIEATYGTFNWWRGASWDQSREFTTSQAFSKISIAAPSRDSFGVIALQNAGSLTIANIQIFDKNGNSSKIQGSFNKNQVAKKKVLTGTYSIEYDLIDPEAGNKLISHWKIENLKVEMGRDEESSTTLTSSVYATLVNNY